MLQTWRLPPEALKVDWSSAAIATRDRRPIIAAGAVSRRVHLFGDELTNSASIRGVQSCVIPVEDRSSAIRDGESCRRFGDGAENET